MSRNPLTRRVANTVEKLLRRGISLPSAMALRVLNLPGVESRLLGPRYERAVKAHSARLPILDGLESRIVGELDRGGLSVSSIEELDLGGSDEMIRSARRVADELAERSATTPKHTLTARQAQLAPYPIIFRWGLAMRLLRIVEAYLRLPVGYDGLSFYYSMADSREAGPRVWHRDREDRRMIKVAVYLNDVDDDGGPYEVMRPEPNARMIGRRGFSYQNLPTEAAEQILGAPRESWVQSVTGPAGTVFFSDTAHYYHRGKPPVATHRSAIFYHYFSRPPRHPFLCERSPFTQRQIADLVADMEPAQQAAARWRDDVSPLMRLIPKNIMRV
jgi:hypothetical protein